MTIQLDLTSVDVRLGRDRQVMYCTDWSALVLAALSGHPLLTVRHHGPGSCGASDVIVARPCEYCETAPATGYVRAYDAHVCRACYDDHHGRGC